jgi:hypothetical protein
LVSRLKAGRHAPPPYRCVSDADGNTNETANNPIRLSASGERPKTARSPLLDKHREALIREFMTINGHAKLSQIRQLVASNDVDHSFVNLAMQQ